MTCLEFGCLGYPQEDGRYATNDEGIRQARMHGLIETDRVEKGKVLYKLTELGTQFFNDLQCMVPGEEPEPVATLCVDVEVEVTDRNGIRLIPGMFHASEQYTRLADYVIENGLFRNTAHGSHVDSVIFEIEKLGRLAADRLKVIQSYKHQLHKIRRAARDMP
jgi:DNA-binding PadR family transcriptional regulator